MQKYSIKKCPLCDSPQLDGRFKKRSFTILGCKNCRAVFLDNTPTLKGLKDFYSKGYFRGKMPREGYFDYIGDKKLAIENSINRLEEIEKYKKGGTLLDVGCAAGFFLEAARQRGWKTCGAEISEFASKFAKDELGLDVFSGAFLENNFAEEYFDVITMWDMIEHTHSPLENLRKAFKLLKKDGLLVFTTPNSDSITARLLGKKWYFFQPPQHLFYFNKVTIAEALRRSGFYIFKMEEEGKYYSLGHILYCLSGWHIKSAIAKIRIYLDSKDILKIYCIKL